MTISTLPRVDRWRSRAEVCIADIGKIDNLVPVAWVEEIERRPMVDIVIDFLRDKRGVDATDPTPEQAYYAGDDEAYETVCSARAIASHDAWVVDNEIIHRLRRPHGIPADSLHDFMKCFYCAGDRGIDCAIERAARCAFSWVRDNTPEEMTA